MFAFPSLRMVAPILCLTLGAVVPLVAQQTPVGTPRTLPDLPYVTGATERQKLDLYLPASPGPHPLVVWIHGGGWENSSRKEFYGQALVEHGFVVASLGYRLHWDAQFPAQLQDVKAAVRWLRAHAGEYGIDPTRVAAWGMSAGGHLAALLGTTGQDRRLDVGENLDQSSAVQAVMDWFGPADFEHWGDAAAQATLDLPQSAVARLIGGPVHTHLDAARAASPVTFVDKNSAPFLILHGDRDNIVPLQQSQELDAALRKAGVESTLVVVPGAGHGGPAFGSPEIVGRIAYFLTRHLGTATK